MLPELRPELFLFPAAPDPEGRPHWVIYDPLRHRYFQISEQDLNLLALFPLGNGDNVRRHLQQTGLSYDFDGMNDLIKFLNENQLVLNHGKAKGIGEQRKKSIGDSVAETFSLKIPLLRPQRFINATLPYAALLVSMPVILAWVLLTLTGVYLAARQWDVFLAAASAISLADAMVAYGLTLIAVKVLHELGHAYIAAARGCTVTSMGVMFYFYFPVLYTDTSDVWRVADRKKRLLVDLGGILVELAIAGVATFFWAILPDGNARSMAFFFATTSWFMSIVVNLNPLAKFDGYYLLCDLIGIENLYERSLSLVRKRVEGWLFDGPVRNEEVLGRRYMRSMMAYGVMVLVYRISLLVGVAVSAYLLVSKVLGVAVFLFLGYRYVVAPLSDLVTQWRRAHMKLRARVRVAGIAFVIIAALLLFAPLDRRIGAEAVLVSGQEVALRSHEIGRIETVHVKQGDRVVAGQVLFRVNSPELAVNRASENVRRVSLEDRLERIAGDLTDLSEAEVLNRQLLESQVSLQGVSRREASLEITAPHTGVVTDMAEGLHPGRWVATDILLARLIVNDRKKVVALVGDDDVARIKVGAGGRFVFEDGARYALPCRVVSIEPSAVEYVGHPELLVSHGGGIHANEVQPGLFKPVNAYHRVVLDVTEAGAEAEPLNFSSRGRVIVDAEASGFLDYLVQRFKRVAIAELAS